MQRPGSGTNVYTEVCGGMQRVSSAIQKGRHLVTGPMAISIAFKKVIPDLHSNH